MARVRSGEAANPSLPTVVRVRLRFAKRGRLRFLSHRDVARSIERAVRRAAVPVSYSHGFSPHPRLTWNSAAPTGTASEAEYLEIGLTRAVDPGELARALDAALPEGLDILGAALSDGGALADRIDAAQWRIELAGVEVAALQDAVNALLAATEVLVERVTPKGRRHLDVRAALVRAEVTGGAAVDDTSAVTSGAPDCAILTAVVRQGSPVVRPDDVLGALDVVAGLRPPVPARATRLAQGLLDDRGELADPLGSDRVTTRA